MGRRWSGRPKGDRVPGRVVAAASTALLLTLAGASPAMAADTTPPTVTNPVSRFATGATVGTATAPITVSWTSYDDWTGVARHQLQQSTDGGTFTNVTLSGYTATSAVRTVSLGHNYRFRVRAGDNAGNWSAWRASAAFTFYIHQETSGNIVYQGTWTRIAVAGASGGYSKYSNQPPGRAKFTIAAMAIAWVGERCWECGKSEVWVNGAYATTVNTYYGTSSGTVQVRRVIYSRTWSSVASRNVELRPEGTMLYPRVYIDAFYVLN
jgi:hypothetical protein